MTILVCQEAAAYTPLDSLQATNEPIAVDAVVTVVSAQAPVWLESIQPIPCLSATFFWASSQEVTLYAVSNSDKLNSYSCRRVEKVDHH